MLQKGKLALFLLFIMFNCSENKHINVSNSSLDSLGIYNKMVYQSLARGDTLNALCITERILEISLNEESINRYREIYLANASYDRPINFFKGLLNKCNRRADCRFGLGMAYIDKIQNSSGPEAGMLAGLAIEEFNKAIAIDSVHWSSHYALGATYLHMPPEFCLYEEAVEIFNRLITIQNKSDTLLPKYALTYASLGDAYVKIEKYNEAVAIWKQGLELFLKETELINRLESK